MSLLLATDCSGMDSWFLRKNPSLHKVPIWNGSISNSWNLWSLMDETNNSNSVTCIYEVERNYSVLRKCILYLIEFNPSVSVQSYQHPLSSKRLVYIHFREKKKYYWFFGILKRKNVLFEPVKILSCLRPNESMQFMSSKYRNIAEHLVLV